MEIRIGLQNNARELVVESDQDRAGVAAVVEAALGGSAPLKLEDKGGSTVIVPSGALAYVELGSPEPRRVGFTG